MKPCRRWAGIVFGVVVGCASFVPGVEQESDVVVTERDVNREVTLTRGATLTVRLGAQLGTGSSWRVAENDPSLLKPTGPPVIEGSADRPGGFQEQVFRFQAQKAGATRLVFRYARPWEREQSPEKTFQVGVKIR